MEIIKTYTKHFRIQQASKNPFMNYGKFKAIRKGFGMSYEKVCFKCGKRLEDEEDAFLIITSGGNRLVCQECNSEIVETLKTEKEE